LDVLRPVMHDNLHLQTLLAETNAIRREPTRQSYRG
jgi:hypothetical protein